MAASHSGRSGRPVATQIHDRASDPTARDATMKTPCRLLVSVALWSLSLSAAAAISARLDPAQAAPGEAVQLILKHDGQTGKQPDRSEEHTSELQSPKDLVCRL